jgi:hypothetical protein
VISAARWLAAVCILWIFSCAVAWSSWRSRSTAILVAPWQF